MRDGFSFAWVSVAWVSVGHLDQEDGQEDGQEEGERDWWYQKKYSHADREQRTCL